MSSTGRRIRWRGALLLVAAPALLAGCAIPLGPSGSGQQSADQRSLVEACRLRADEAYDITHRDQIYASGSQVNTPFSANYQPGITDRGLADRYEHERMISDCVRNTGAEGSRVPPGTTAAAVPPAPRQ